jgi:putative oxidoreductase
MNKAINTNSPVPAIGRLLMAAIFLLSGIGKIAAPAATIGYIAAMGLPMPSVAYIGAVVLEVGGGLLLLAGLQTRLTALALAVFSVVTGLAFHHAIGDQNQMIHLLKNFAMAGGLLQVVAFGAGAYSLDNRKATATLARTA